MAFVKTASFLALVCAAPVSPFSTPAAVPSAPIIATELYSTTTSSSADESTGFEIASVDMAVPDIPSIPPTSKRLFLVRHGEVINPGGNRPVYYGALDVSLSPLGEKEAQAAAAYLERFDLQRVAASPLSRAKFGANEVLSLQQSDSNSLVIYDGFMELDRGAWCGKTGDEIGSDMLVKFDACDPSVTPEGGESYLALKDRVLKARDELLETTDCGRASAVVSHLQVTRSMLSDALGITTDKMAKLKVATASVTCIDFCSITGEQTVHFKSFKPEVGLQRSKDMAN